MNSIWGYVFLFIFYILSVVMYVSILQWFVAFYFLCLYTRKVTEKMLQFSSSRVVSDIKLDVVGTLREYSQNFSKSSRKTKIKLPS